MCEPRSSPNLPTMKQSTTSCCSSIQEAVASASSSDSSGWSVNVIHSVATPAWWKWRLTSVIVARSQPLRISSRIRSEPLSMPKAAERRPESWSSLQRSGVKYFSIFRSLDQRILTPLSIKACARRTA